MNKGIFALLFGGLMSCAAHQKLIEKQAWCRENAPSKCEMPKSKAHPFLWLPVWWREEPFDRTQAKQCQPDSSKFGKGLRACDSERVSLFDQILRRP